jgi:hypothetical protein
MKGTRFRGQIASGAPDTTGVRSWLPSTQNRRYGTREIGRSERWVRGRSRAFACLTRSCRFTSGGCPTIALLSKRSRQFRQTLDLALARPDRSRPRFGMADYASQSAAIH